MGRKKRSKNKKEKSKSSGCGRRKRSRSPLDNYNFDQSNNQPIDKNNNYFNNNYYKPNDNINNNHMFNERSVDKPSGNYNYENYHYKSETTNNAIATPIALPYHSINESIKETRISTNNNKNKDNKGKLSHASSISTMTSSNSSVRSSSTKSKSSSSSDSSKNIKTTKSLNKTYEVTHLRDGYTPNYNTQALVKKKDYKMESTTLNQASDKPVPILSTNKTYNIAFSLDRKLSTDHNRSVWTSENMNKAAYAEQKSLHKCHCDHHHHHQHQHRCHHCHGHHHSKKRHHSHHHHSNKRSSKKTVTKETKNDIPFSSLMTDVNVDTANSQKHYDAYQTSNGNAYGAAANENNSTYFSNELTEKKEYIMLEKNGLPAERREFRRVITGEGDTNFVDVKNGEVLKKEEASWKSGSEWFMDGKKSKKVNYKWIKDENTGEWSKYNADTNQLIKKGDWKSGSEWYRNSKGKYVERSYEYRQNADGTFSKYDRMNGKPIMNHELNKLHEWKKNKGKGCCGKNKNPKWSKREYIYVEKNNGKWIKQNVENGSTFGKQSKYGWKRGKDYHMDPKGKIKKVKYRWETAPDGVMKPMIGKKNKKLPLNNSWKEGKETKFINNAVSQYDYAWVKSGRKWVKIDQNTGLPISNKMKSKAIHKFEEVPSNNQYSMFKKSKTIDKNHVLEENTQIRQDNNGYMKSIVKTVKDTD